MFGFDKMFDFDHDGRLDSFERAAEIRDQLKKLRELRGGGH